MESLKSQVLELLTERVKSVLENAEGGHDWWHIQRVLNNANAILLEEMDADAFVVRVTVLLHDIADAKFHDGDENIGLNRAKSIMSELHIDSEIAQKVLDIMSRMSFRTSLESTNVDVNLELAIVQDADRLDAIGAIGIARAFNYGGHKARKIYDPEMLPLDHMTKSAYVKSQSPTINHFYEKLLLLKSLMNTNAGKRMALERHEFMEEYLRQFYKEWDGRN